MRIRDFLSILWLSVAPGLFAQAAATPDVLILVDGEKLVGRFERSNGGTVTFKSDILGVLTVDWSKVQELQTSQPYAVVGKDVKLGRKPDTSRIPQGKVTVSGQVLSVQTAPDRPAEQIPVPEAAHVIEQSVFQNEVLRSPGPLEAWNGTVTAGASLVAATQSSRTFTGGIHLVRAVPVETWLQARDRTTIDFSAASGIVTQPNTPRLKTEIFHAGAERDQYFTDRVFAFGQALYDHNFSQGLDLQQNYGGGIGWTAIKRANETLDLKGSLNYLKQQFQIADLNQNLIASTLGEAFTHKYAHGITLVQQLAITATWNNLNAYNGAASAILTFPVYKRLSFSVGSVDTFLNNPPPGFKKNSFQFTTGLTYALK